MSPSEDEKGVPIVEARPAAKCLDPAAKRKSAAINNVLGLDIDWTELDPKDLDLLYKTVTDAGSLRKLGIRVLRSRFKRLKRGVKNEARGVIRDILHETKLGEKAMNFLYGDDEEEET